MKLREFFYIPFPVRKSYGWIPLFPGYFGRR